MKKNNRFLGAFLFPLFSTWGFLGTTLDKEPSTQDPPPNIVYILADDLGYGDLGCYGQKTLATPHIDRLALDGMRFTRHYAGSTVCAPSRASLLTGKHAGHISVRGNSPPGQLIKDHEITIAEALKTSGYVSAVIGKWGVGHPPPLDDPSRNGFDHHFGYINMWHAHNFYPEFLYRNGLKMPLEGNELNDELAYPNELPEGTGVAKHKFTYAPNELQKEAIKFIEDHRAQPFFLFMSLNLPHANNEAGRHLGDGLEVPMVHQHDALRPDYGQYNGEDWPDPEKGFAQMISLLDQCVGAIDSIIDHLGLGQNTVIAFSSDNGPHNEGGHSAMFFNSSGPLRGTKRDLYEGGIRVPLIVKWSGKIVPATVTNHASGFFDLLPTFCEIAGASKPEGIDGISFLPTLLGKEKNQKQHEFLYWEFYEQGGSQAALKNDWKYIKRNVRNPDEKVIKELYHLATDLAEENNLIDLYPKRKAEFETIMQRAHTPSSVISLFSPN